jgi:hypothetical protein
MPQFRNIERFWTHLKRNVYSEGWVGGSVGQLIRKIKREIKFPESYFQSLLSQALPTVQFSKPLSSFGKVPKTGHFLKNFYEFDGV